MTKLEKIKREIEALVPDELAHFRRQIEADARSGRLDALVEEALADHRAGRTRPL